MTKKYLPSKKVCNWQSCAIMTEKKNQNFVFHLSFDVLWFQIVFVDVLSTCASRLQILGLQEYSLMHFSIHCHWASWVKGFKIKIKPAKSNRDKNCLLFCSYKSEQIKQKYVVLCSFRLTAYSVGFSCDKQWQMHPLTVRWLFIDMAAIIYWPVHHCDRQSGVTKAQPFHQSVTFSAMCHS